jgi:hypothetical protein
MFRRRDREGTHGGERAFSSGWTTRLRRDKALPLYWATDRGREGSCPSLRGIQAKPRVPRAFRLIPAFSFAEELPGVPRGPALVIHVGWAARIFRLNPRCVSRS